jgi:hypothetical protein
LPLARVALLFGEGIEEPTTDQSTEAPPEPVPEASAFPSVRAIVGPPWRVVLVQGGSTGEGRVATVGDTLFGFTVVGVRRDSVVLQIAGRNVALAIGKPQ